MNALLLGSLLLSTAQATWSIVAYDTTSNVVGGAGTSCVGTFDVSIILGVSPANGAVHAQAYLNEQARDQAVELLSQGQSPADIVAVITAGSFDPQSGYRQYGIVDSQGRSAGFTGPNNGDWAGDVQGTVDNIVYSVQGNILTSETVVQRTADRFQAHSSCDLAENLWEALKSGRRQNEGDSRCTDSGIPSDSAFIRVVNPDGSDLLHLSVVGDSQEDPLDRLQLQFDDWRAANPCPEIEDPTVSEDKEGRCQIGPNGSSVWLFLLAGGVLMRRFDDT